MKLKYVGFTLFFVLIFSGCTPQNMNQLSQIGKLVNIKLPSAGLVKNKSSKSNKNYVQHYPKPKHSCGYYESHFGNYSAPAKACRQIRDRRPRCLSLERRWSYSATVVGPVAACRNNHKRAMWTIDAYDKTDKCYNWIDISMIEYNKCIKKQKAKRR